MRLFDKHDPYCVGRARARTHILAINSHRAGAGRGINKNPESVRTFGDLVAPTGVDPVTFRFSVERSTN